MNAAHIASLNILFFNSYHHFVENESVIIFV